MFGPKNLHKEQTMDQVDKKNIELDKDIHCGSFYIKKKHKNVILQ
jgi:hypothetical protein